MRFLAVVAIAVVMQWLCSGCTPYSTRVYKPKTYSSPEMLQWQTDKVVKEQMYLDSLSAVVYSIAFPLRKNALRLLPYDRYPKEFRTQFGYMYRSVDLWDRSKVDLHVKKAIQELYGLDLSAYASKDQPIHIVSVIDGSPIQRAGMRAGDKLLSIGGVKVTTQREKDRLFTMNNHFRQGTTFRVQRKLSDTLVDTLSL